jgi:hypothetical protein
METNTARNFALQLGSLIALYVSLSALIMVVFGVIEVRYPDDATWYGVYDGAQTGIRFGIAMLVVFFPTYIVLTRIVNEIRRKETGTYLTLTKWLVYLSLLIGGSILLGDLVAVILTYLNGEITLRFILKALTLLVVIGAAFYYYILDARSYWINHEKESRAYAFVTTFIVVGALALGFMHSASPSEVREMRLDEQQVYDLQDLQWRIEDHYRVTGSLPTTTDMLYVGIEAPEAPEDREPYTYAPLSETRYELCASFALSSHPEGSKQKAPLIESTAQRNPYNNWDHGAGETCFEREVIEEKTAI